MYPKYYIIIISYLIYFILIFLLGELSLRVFLPNHYYTLKDERNTIYNYHEKLGWFQKPNQQVLYKASQEFIVNTNNQGFRDKDYGLKKKDRILFIGDSFTWGYDVEEKNRFTNNLQQKLLNSHDVLNMGVSGYGTDQSYLILQDYFESSQADIVFLLFCMMNDREENMSKSVYHGYYKPYFILKDSMNIELAGIPSKKSFRYFFARHPLLAKSRLLTLLGRIQYKITKPNLLERDPTEAILLSIKEFVEERGAKFIIGFTDGDGNTEEVKWSKKNNINYLLLTNNFTFPTHGEHWTIEGNKYVSDRIYEYLLSKEFIKNKQ
jgi:hypothetical protein